MRQMIKRLIISLLILLLLIIVGGGGWLHWRVRASLPQPPAQVHLPQAVLRSHVTLREEQVLERGGTKVRNAACVA